MKRIHLTSQTDMSAKKQELRAQSAFRLVLIRKVGPVFSNISPFLNPLLDKIFAGFEIGGILSPKGLKSNVIRVAQAERIFLEFLL